MARTVSPAEHRALLQTLADGGWHSGARLAESAGLTRAGLAKRLHGLEALGLELETRTGTGYRLAQPLELLDADVITGALPAARRSLPVTVAFSTDSTNRQLLDGPGTDPRALLAEHQTAGRGRRGRTWHSPLGANLYLSLSYAFDRWPSQLGALPLAVGVASVRALAALGIAGLKLKWPNDVLHDGRKLGGLLIEQRGEAGAGCRVVIGLGLNVSMRSAPGIEQPWASLAQVAGTPPSRNALAAALLQHWLELLDRFAAEGFAPQAAEWRALDATAGRAVTVHDGKGSFDGVARGVDEHGALQVDCGGELRRVLAGDVSLRVKKAK